MRFKEWFLTEIFDTTAQINWSKRTNTDWFGSFNIKDKQYVIRMVRAEGSPWEISFDLVRGKKTTQDITGTGDAAYVFSTVLNGISQWLTSTNPDSFVISAREPNRQSLYRRILKLLPKVWDVEELGTTFFVTNTSMEQPAYSGYKDDDFSDYWDNE